MRIVRACRALGLEAVRRRLGRRPRDSAAARLADRAVCIGPARATESYLRPETIVQAALGTGCDAIHPGYGFLSENPRLAALARDGGDGVRRAAARGDRARGRQAPRPRRGGRGGAAARPRRRGGGPSTTRARSPPTPATRCCSRPRAAVAGAASSSRATSPTLTLSASRSPRPTPPSATRACTSSASSPPPATSRCRSPPTRTATSSTSASATAPSSAATRRSSRRRPRRRSPPSSGRRSTAARVAFARAIGYVNLGTVEFMVDADRRALLPRVQLPHPGRAPRDRGGDRPRPCRRAAADRGGRGAGLRAGRCRPRRPRGRGAPDGRGRRPRFRPSPGRWSASPSRTAGLRVDTHCADGTLIPPHYDSLMAKLIGRGPDRASAVGILARGPRRPRGRGRGGEPRALLAESSRTATSRTAR